MSKIQQLLADKKYQIDYYDIISKFPWIIEKNQNCVLSPDSDGILCGLFMSHYFDWKIKGFYDGKIMLLEKDINAKDCIFLDVDIFRKDIRSLGHHMVLYNKSKLPNNWENYKNCIQPNLFRSYDGYHDFRLKYPLASIHLLIGIIGSKFKIEIPESAICPLFFTDGTFNVLFSYPENVLNWLEYLRANEVESPLKKVFENEKYSVFKLMKAMDDFFRQRDEISVSRERGDRLRISLTNGEPYNIVPNTEYFDLDIPALNRIQEFKIILSELTKWEYKQSNWTWTNFKLYKFTKRSFEYDKLRINNTTFANFVSQNPLSWAMTSGTNIEYTLEYPDKLY